MTCNFFFVSITIICLIAVACSGSLGPDPQNPSTPSQLPASIQIPGEIGPNANTEKYVIDGITNLHLIYTQTCEKIPSTLIKRCFSHPSVSLQPLRLPMKVPGGAQQKKSKPYSFSRLIVTSEGWDMRNSTRISTRLIPRMS